MGSIGVIGLGLMGSALAERFRVTGLRVIGHDVRRECRERFAKGGGEPVDSARAVFDSAELIVLSLPDSNAVEVVVESAGTIRTGTTIIDTSTGDPEAAAKMGQCFASRGVEYLDATLTGSSEVARSGELVVTAGGPVEVFAKAEPVFQFFARQWFHVGPWGNGMRAKLIVNLVLGLNRAVLAEGLAFAARIGLNQEVVLEILRSGAAFSRVMDSKGRKMIHGEFTPEAKLDQHLKDVRLILEAGGRSSAVLPFSQLHEGMLAKLASRGLGGIDNSAIIRAFSDVRE